MLRLLFLTGFLLTSSALADERVVCASYKDRRNYCDIYKANEADIYLSRRLSESSCIEDISWGRDRSGVWVDNGCRAEFSVRRRGGHHEYGDNPYQLHGSYGNKPYGNYDRYDYEQERQRELEREIERTRRAREELERERQRAEEAAKREQCPAGFEPGNHRCTNEERRRGCKDMRMPGGTTCSSRGWGYK